MESWDYMYKLHANEQYLRDSTEVFSTCECKDKQLASRVFSPVNLAWTRFFSIRELSIWRLDIWTINYHLLCLNHGSEQLVTFRPPHRAWVRVLTGQCVPPEELHPRQASSLHGWWLPPKAHKCIFHTLSAQG